MKRVLLSVCVLLCLSGLLVVAGFAADLEINIDVAPNVLNLSSKSVCVTVHTDIPYSAVAGHTVSLNGIEISSWKSDNRGNFVAKFDSDEVKTLPGIEKLERLELTLSGVATTGAFFGTSEITVINVSEKKGR